MDQCSSCAYYAYDEDYEDYFCDVYMDEDDYARLMGSPVRQACPYYRDGDEYKVIAAGIRNSGAGAGLSNKPAKCYDD